MLGPDTDPDMPVMRTTLKLEDDVFAYAKPLSVAQGRPLGEVVSDLARKGMKRRPARHETRNGLVLFKITPGGRTVSPEDVRRGEKSPDKRIAGLVAGR